MSAGAFVHLTSSTPAREHVEELLETLGRKERVLELPDGMPNEGPLCDIDADGPCVLVEAGVLEARADESDADFPEQLRIKPG